MVAENTIHITVFTTQLFSFQTWNHSHQHLINDMHKCPEFNRCAKYWFKRTPGPAATEGTFRIPLNAQHHRFPSSRKFYVSFNGLFQHSLLEHIRYLIHVALKWRHFCPSSLRGEGMNSWMNLRWINDYIHRHPVICLTTGSKPLPKRSLHILRSTASSFKCQYPLLSLRSSSSFLRLLLCLLVTSISPFIFPTITSFRRQFLRKMWPIQLAFLFLIVRGASRK